MNQVTFLYNITSNKIKLYKWGSETDILDKMCTIFHNLCQFIHKKQPYPQKLAELCIWYDNLDISWQLGTRINRLRQLYPDNRAFQHPFFSNVPILFYPYYTALSTYFGLYFYWKCTTRHFWVDCNSTGSNISRIPGIYEYVLIYIQCLAYSHIVIHKIQPYPY